MSAPAQTFLVDAGGGGDFSSLQAAVLAVPDDSVLRLVSWPDPAAGSYGSMELSGKSLTVYGLGGTPVNVDWVRIADLDPLQSVTFHNVHFFTANETKPALEVVDCAGTVRLHGCRLSSMEHSSSSPRPTLLMVNQAADVTLDRCTVDGAEGSFRPGVLIEDSRLTATRSSLIAGDASLAFALNEPRDGDSGRTGVEVRGRSFVWLGDCLVEGGDGQSIQNGYAFMGLARGGDGGTGLLVAPGASCVLVDTVLRAGAPGGYYDWFGSGPHNPGALGADLVGAAQSVAGEQRALDVMQPMLSSNEPLVLRAQGLPGEHVTLYGSRTAGFRFLGPLIGVFGLRVPDPTLTLTAGVIPASGVLEFHFDPPLPTGMPLDRLDLQAVCRTGVDRFRVTNVASIVRLDPTLPRPEAFERLHVDPSAAPGGDGSTWSKALHDLEFAMRVAGGTAQRQVEVWIAEGRYTAQVGASLPGAFILADGLRLIGGFPAGGSAFAQRDSNLYRVILDADWLGNDGPGFTARNDNATVLMRPTRAHPNQPLQAVTGVHIEGLWFRGVRSQTGSGFESSAAIYTSGDVSIHDCRFTDATALAVSALGATHMRNCRIEASESTGVLVRTGELTLEGSLFIDCNLWQGNFHSVVRALGSPATITSCTFRRCGQAPPPGGACSTLTVPLVLGTHHGFVMRNCLFWENSCAVVPESSVGAPGTADIRYCGFESLSALTGDPTNRTLDPRFLSASDSGLAAGSPYIDAGDNAALPADFLRDLAGGWRVVDDPATPSTGPGGGTRVVDLGALERQ
ncbi:MAG: right-handed parallel beta-helix repeat-containing protein [Planctomycetota bacterium]